MRKKHKNIRKGRNNKLLKILWVLAGLVGLVVVVYFLPPIHDRLSWRVDNLRAKVYYFFNPPGKVIFSPAQQAEMEAIVQMTQTAMALQVTATLEAFPTATNPIEATVLPSATSTPTSLPSPTFTPIPEAFSLRGVTHEYQKMNNCGPATLSMALSFWGWEGDQLLTREWLRPHEDDRNVMPYEMVDAVQAHTDLKALVRWGGDAAMLKQFIAAGFPVIIERDMGDVRPDKDWTGHYGVVSGYNDATGRLILQDSFVMANYPLVYGDFTRYWRAFNYVFVVIYPPARESEVMNILGSHADETLNYQFAAQKAQEETSWLEGRDLFFAWFNLGSSLVNLDDFFGAAQAYDQAYNNIYTTIPEKARPFRMTWYQTGPYFAYYFTGRYQDVINLADLTLAYNGVSEIEETWIWRGRARLALGDQDGAIEDFKKALKYHPGWEPAEAELRSLGITP